MILVYIKSNKFRMNYISLLIIFVPVYSSLYICVLYVLYTIGYNCDNTRDCNRNIYRYVVI